MSQLHIQFTLEEVEAGVAVEEAGVAECRLEEEYRRT